MVADGLTREQTIAMKSTWRAYERLLEQGERTPDFKIGLAGSFTLEALGPFVGASLLELDLAPACYVAPYNQIFQACLNPAGAFGVDAPLEAIVVLWRLEDLLALECRTARTDLEASLRSGKEKIRELAQTIKHLRANFSGMMIVSTPPFPQGLYMRLDHVSNPTHGGVFHRGLLDEWCKLIAEIGHVYLLDFDGLQRAVGAVQAFDARKWYLYRQPYTDLFMAHLAAWIKRLVRLQVFPPKKCVVLDCDNTLWGGIVGEDGLGGLQLGEDFPGKAYRDLQEILLHWHNQGVLLALASKNNENEVWEVFDRHDAMVLKREHIAAWRINWQPKSANLSELAQELNLGLDSFVFIDDNPWEIEQVLATLPAVTCFNLPEDPARIAEAVLNTHFFDRIALTEEDRHRTAMMLHERQRKSQQSQMSADDFIASLELKVETFPVLKEHLGRVTQLISKTNQFNLTTIRRTQAQVHTLHEDPKAHIYAIRVCDRFGDYGLTGVVIALEEISGWRLDTFLLSCRVLGRGVETAALAFIAGQARAAGAASLYAKYMPTPKNAPCAQFLPQHGFQNLSGEDWRLDLLLTHTR